MFLVVLNRVHKLYFNTACIWFNELTFSFFQFQGNKLIALSTSLFYYRLYFFLYYSTREYILEAVLSCCISYSTATKRMVKLPECLI